MRFVFILFKRLTSTWTMREIRRCRCQGDDDDDDDDDDDGAGALVVKMHCSTDPVQR